MENDLEVTATARNLGRQAGTAAKHNDWALVKHHADYFRKWHAMQADPSMLQAEYDSAYKMAARRGMGLAL